jgi:hypothetical protein
VVTEAATVVVFVVGAASLLALGSDSSLVVVLVAGCVRNVYNALKAAPTRSETDRDEPADDRKPTDPTDHAVLAALEDGPRTRRELWDAVDADARTIDASLDRLRKREAVERAGSEYRIAPDPEPGLVERLRSLVPGRGRVAGRDRAPFEHTTDGADRSREAALSSVAGESDANGAIDSRREPAARRGGRRRSDERDGAAADGRDGTATGGRGRDHESGREYETADR